MRNVAIGADGTWNKPNQQDRDRQAPSNVVKMVRSIDEESTEIRQLKYYNTGVGTKGLIDKFHGGVAGKGLFGNMRQAYAWLIEHHQEDDHLFLFGFSRGAFTVRSLAGMLSVCGIPKNGEDPMALAEQASEVYRIHDKQKRQAEGERFQKERDSLPGTVHFIGVWDTVGALGLPTKGFLGKRTRKKHSFHDMTLGSNIRHAYHALAINEQRGPFEPSLWRGTKPEEVETVLQSWFPGVHSNVGGGYVDAGLSDRALFWMIENAKRHGLRFNQQYVDCRIDPNWFGELRDSLTFAYKIPLVEKHGLRELGTGALGEHLHFSAGKRWQSPSRPDDMPANLLTAAAKALPVDYSCAELNVNDTSETLPGL